MENGKDKPRNTQRERLIEPLDRISEILFGLIMAVTIVGSLSVASAGQSEVRTVLIAALGCNLAWGLVDAVMYVVRTVTERTRNRALARQVIAVDAAAGNRLIDATLPPHVRVLVGPAEIEAMRRRLLALGPPSEKTVQGSDLLAALGIFLLVVIATFPVVIPFLLFDDAARAMNASRIVSLAMLLAAGFALGRYAGYEHPLRTGILMMLFGAVLIVVVMALGG